MTEFPNRRNVRERPPERFHAFISYTTREDEVRLIKPAVDLFLNDFLKPRIESALGEPPIFFDSWSLSNPPNAIVPDYLWRTWLDMTLRFAIEESEMLIAFVSPRYCESYWCMLEIKAMGLKRPRPWYDICRKPPSDDMRDRRLRHMRPSHLECLKAALARRMPGRTRVPVGVESPILPIVWKGGPDVLAGLGLSPDCQTFDWRACGRYWELNKEIAEHQSRHGSVSPSWGEEAAAELQICSKVMSSTAMAIAGVLQDRRKAYRQLARRGRSSNAQSVVS